MAGLISTIGSLICAAASLIAARDAKRRAADAAARLEAYLERCHPLYPRD